MGLLNWGKRLRGNRSMRGQAEGVSADRHLDQITRRDSHRPENRVRERMEDLRDEPDDLEEDTSEEVLLETGTMLDSGQRALGLKGKAGAARLGENLAGFIPIIGQPASAFLGGIAEQQTTDEQLEKMLKRPTVRKKLARILNRPDPDLEDLKEFISANNPELHDHLEKSGNFVDGMGSGVAGLVGGSVAAAATGGLLMPLVGGGLASYGWGYIRGQDGNTNVPVLVNEMAEFEENALKNGVDVTARPAYGLLLAATARLTNEQQKDIEAQLGMSLEQAIYTWMEGIQDEVNGQKPDADFFLIEKVMSEPAVDATITAAVDKHDMLSGRRGKKGYQSIGKQFADARLGAADILLDDPVMLVLQSGRLNERRKDAQDYHDGPLRPGKTPQMRPEDRPEPTLKA